MPNVQFFHGCVLHYPCLGCNNSSPNESARKPSSIMQSNTSSNEINNEKAEKVQHTHRKRKRERKKKHTTRENETDDENLINILGI